MESATVARSVANVSVTRVIVRVPINILMSKLSIGGVFRE
jgi:hypothetical protein